jgi:hypothetical protein
LSLLAGGVINLAPSPTPQLIPYPSGANNQPTSVKLANNSAFTLQLYLGGALEDTLEPYTINVYPLQPANAAGRTPAPPLTYTTVEQTALGGTLTATFGFYGDTFVGSYPEPLPIGLSSGTTSVSVPNPGAGQDWAYQLSTPARLVSLSGFFDKGAGSSYDWLPSALIVNPSGSYVGFFPIGTAPLSQAGPFGWFLTLAIGLQLATVTGGTAYSLATGPLPDLGVLPEGSTVESNAEPTAADSWQQVVLLFTPL